MILFLLFFLGIAMLVYASDLLISGASSLALRLKVAPLVIGLTVVAFGTSLPELMVSITGALEGATRLVLGAIIGSNIVNILLIPGVMAFITPLRLKKNTIWKEIPMSFLGAIVLSILGLEYVLEYRTKIGEVLGSTDEIGQIGLANGLVLLCFFVIFLYYAFSSAKKDTSIKLDIPRLSGLRSGAYMLIGLAGLVAGSHLTVTQSVAIADTYNLGRTFVGLTLVALSTSAPELITGIVAALKRQTDIGVGNIIGSNIFNIFMILGITAVIRPLPITGQNIAEILILLIGTAFVFVSLFVLKKHSLGRIEGAGMLIVYGLFLLYLFTR
ncbi:MAG: calcium/sodium antiporter [Patescibacteria group bacterium]|nr:calcium/sodium antiporter [Patescibacteria group bacterium]